jgi:hypothetical protein
LPGNTDTFVKKYRTFERNEQIMTSKRE